MPPPRQSTPSLPQNSEHLPHAHTDEQINGRHRANQAQGAWFLAGILGQHGRQDKHAQPEKKQTIGGPLPAPRGRPRTQPEEDPFP